MLRNFTTERTSKIEDVEIVGFYVWHNSCAVSHATADHLIAATGKTGKNMKTMFIIAALATGLFSASASAVVVTTIGSGSAVTNVQGSADFESAGALFDNPYSEGNMQFSRTNLTFNNNGCGFAGCLTDPNLAPMSGNYMYGLGAGGFFEITPSGGLEFVALELVPASGFFVNLSQVVVVWEAYSGLSLVGSGNVNVAYPSVLGFVDVLGFDRLRFTSTSLTNVADFTSTFNAPAFDSVRSQFTITQVPEPATLLLFGAGLVGLALMRRLTAHA